MKVLKTYMKLSVKSSMKWRKKSLKMISDKFVIKY